MVRTVSERIWQAQGNVSSAHEPVLMAPDFDRPLKLTVDASDVGVGIVLVQEGEAGITNPVSYYSKKLGRHQKAYSTIEERLLWC